MEFIVTVKTNDEIELLSEAGCTTLIFSDEFNGTRVAKKMTREMLSEGFKKCRDLNMKCAVFMNRIYTDFELDQAKEYLLFLKSENIDTIYYNDPAIFMLAEELGMKGKLVYEPDTLMTNSRDMNFVLDQGIHHVVLSTEITCDEMEQMIRNSSGYVEAILFGYLNMSYSKRHLIDVYCDEIGIENNYKDKMDCVLIESTREGIMPIIEDDQGTHIFTDYILDAFVEYPRLKEAGLSAIRLDGIFLDRDVLLDACKAFQFIEYGMDPVVIKQKFEEKYPQLPWSTGYMYQKTNLVK